MNQKGAVVSTLLFWIGIAALSVVCSGCFPLLTGMKHYENGNTKIDFVTGADFSLSANGVDRVNNQRGIQPDTIRQ